MYFRCRGHCYKYLSGMGGKQKRLKQTLNLKCCSSQCCMETANYRRWICVGVAKRRLEVSEFCALRERIRRDQQIVRVPAASYKAFITQVAETEGMDGWVQKDLCFQCAVLLQAKHSRENSTGRHDPMVWFLTANFSLKFYSLVSPLTNFPKFLNIFKAEVFLVGLYLVKEVKICSGVL